MKEIICLVFRDNSKWRESEQALYVNFKLTVKVFCPSVLPVENDQPPYAQLRPQHAGLHSRGDLLPAPEA